MSQPSPYSSSDTVPTDLEEARGMLAGTTRMLPELRHLEALEEHYEAQLILISIVLDQTKKGVLHGTL